MIHRTVPQYSRRWWRIIATRSHGRDYYFILSSRRSCAVEGTIKSMVWLFACRFTKLRKDNVRLQREISSFHHSAIVPSDMSATLLILLLLCLYIGCEYAMSPSPTLCLSVSVSVTVTVSVCLSVSLSLSLCLSLSRLHQLSTCLSVQSFGPLHY